MLNDLVKQTFNSGVDTSKSAWLKFKTQFWDSKISSIRLENITVEVFDSLNIKSNLSCFGCNTSALFDFGALMSTEFTWESHDYDFFKERNRSYTHSDFTFCCTSITISWKFDCLFSNIWILIGLIIYWFAEIHMISRNFWISSLCVRSNLCQQ